jgi:hypothetical protein
MSSSARAALEADQIMRERAVENPQQRVLPGRTVMSIFPAGGHRAFALISHQQCQSPGWQSNVSRASSGNVAD